MKKKKWFDCISIMAIVLSSEASYAYNGGSMENLVITVVAGLFATLVVLLILREFACWYWKINAHVALLTEIRNLLKKNLELEKEKAEPAASLQKQEETEDATLPQKQEEKEQDQTAGQEYYAY